VRSLAPYAAVQLVWTGVLALGEKRAVAALRRRGSARPRRVLGAGVGLAVAASTLPIWWRRAVDRAAEEAIAEAETLAAGSGASGDQAGR
jgi:hypothetical protein